MNARLRNRDLTTRPRVVMSTMGNFWVERENPVTMRIEVEYAFNFSDAIAKANDWAKEAA